jgi:lactoylglutathione lyase
MRYLHTMIRVGNLEKSVKFYTEVLGFKEVSRADYPDGKFTLVFLKSSLNAGENEPLIELTYNWGVEKYEIGGGYGHVAYQVDSMDEIAERVKKAGLSFSWGPGKTPNGKRGMAFLQDPDGYKIELLEG